MNHDLRACRNSKKLSHPYLQCQNDVISRSKATERWPSIPSVIPPPNATEYPWSVSSNTTNKTLDVSRRLCAREAWARPATESHVSRETSPDPQNSRVAKMTH